MVRREKFANAKSYQVKDLWTGEVTVSETGRFSVNGLDGCDNLTILVTPNA